MPFSPTLPVGTLSLDSIDWDTSAKHCQIRQCTQSDVVEEYAAAMKAGIEFPPIIVFTDGTSFWLVDGYHRCEAATDADICELPVDLREGSLRDATLFAVGVNAAHGVRRTNDDKRRAVLTLLNDESWSKWSDNKVAKKCCVSQSFVSKMRSTYFGDKCETRTYERDGEVREMNVANIGKPKDEPTPTPEEARPVDDGDDAAAVDVEADEPAAYDELDHDEETPESFSDELPPPNKFGAFYDLVRERAKAVLSDAVHSDYYVVAGQLYAIAEELEGVAARMKEDG